MKNIYLVAGLVVAMSLQAWQTAPPVSALQIYTYDVRTSGTVYSDVSQFKSHVASTYGDTRGWSAAGASFLEVPSGLQSNFTVWLAAPEMMTSFAAGCDAFYSCRVGRNVIINDERWRTGSPYLEMPLDDYRHMVVNHETGHWFELDHWGCPGAGMAAPVMMQQSKGVLEGCLPNAWPTPAEIETVRQTTATPFALQAPVKLFL